MKKPALEKVLAFLLKNQEIRTSKRESHPVVEGEPEEKEYQLMSLRFYNYIKKHYPEETKDLVVDPKNLHPYTIAPPISPYYKSILESVAKAAGQPYEEIAFDDCKDKLVKIGYL